MKMKRYKKIQEYIRENNISQEETQKIMIERPSEIIVMHDKNNETAGSLHLWHNRPDYNGKKTSYIGNVNIIEKYRKNEENIFDEIFESLRKEGIETIIGPLNGTTWNTYRYVTEKGNGRRFLLEPWNDSEGRKNLDKKMERLKKFSYYKDIRVESAEDKDLLTVLNDVYNLTVESFKNNFLYSELEREIFLKMYMSYEDKILKKFFKMLYLKGELIGYVFGIPDYTELGYKRKIETMILKTIAVSPVYNGKGMGYILINSLVEEAEKEGYENVIYALMHESNVSKNIGLQLGHMLRRYTLFIKEL